MEHCIVYFSTSISLFQESDLASLLQQSQHDNALAGISGILLINQGRIIQVLEGKQEIIEALYKRIEQDRRHTDVIKVVDVPIEKRSFVGWSMACGKMTSHQIDLIKTIVDLGRTDWLLSVMGEVGGLTELELSQTLDQEAPKMKGKGRRTRRTPHVGLWAVRGVDLETRAIIEKGASRVGKTIGEYVNEDIRSMVHTQLTQPQLPAAPVDIQNQIDYPTKIAEALLASAERSCKEEQARMPLRSIYPPQ
jgi:hypothetical protein